MKPRILIITHHFPPSTVAASFRPLRLAKYLPRMGYRVWVLSTTKGAYSEDGRRDYELAKDVPPEVSVTRIPNLNPVLWYSSRGHRLSSAPSVAARPIDEETKAQPFRINIKSVIAEIARFPDIDISWALASLIPAVNLVLRNHIDLIYTNGPPFGAHILGLLLKKLTKRAWIAQYGNPWTENPSIFWQSDFLRGQCKRLDRAIVRSADSVLVMDEILAGCISALGRSDGIHIYTNGFDPEHFVGVDLPTGKFTITYAGSLYNVHNPQIIYDAFSLIEQINPAARADMRVVFAGSPESDPLRVGAPSDFVFTGALRHSQIIARLLDSHLLVDFLTAPSDSKFTVSCKLYEYMAARRPVLAVTPDGPMAQEVLRLNLGRVVSSDDPALVADAILDFYHDYKSGTLRAPDTNGIEAYSAPNLAQQFASIAEDVCSAALLQRSCAKGRSK